MPHLEEFPNIDTSDLYNADKTYTAKHPLTSYLGRTSRDTCTVSLGLLGLNKRNLKMQPMRAIQGIFFEY